MLRRVTRSLAVAWVAVVALVVGGVVPAGAQDPPPPGPTDTVAPVPPPRASIVVDVETGQVVTEANSREPLPPASTTKILTALLARQHLDFDGDVGISGTAALAPPRRIGMEYGSSWGVEDLTYAMMHCSCNDAAWALGQAAGGGTMTGFASRAQALAEDLGLVDDPLVRDPAGLDDDRSVAGGNLLSARDLAIAGRAYLADPVLAEIARAPGHEWVGGDDEPHSVRNLNAFLGAYPGAIGLKTGFTSRAGMTLVAAAERDGRTLLAVVLGSDAHYAHARELLDAGFMLAAVEESTGDVLPPVPDGDGTTTTTTTTSTTAPEPASSAEPTTPPTTTEVDGEQAAAGTPVRSAASEGGLPAEALWLAVGGVAALVVVALALLARERAVAGTIDRRPAKPRRRDRRRDRRRAGS